MLSLSRKVGQTIHIGNNIVVTLSHSRSGSATTTIDAPDYIRILRGELAENIEEIPPLAEVEIIDKDQ